MTTETVKPNESKTFDTKVGDPSADKAVHAFLEVKLDLGTTAKVHKVDRTNVFDNFWRVNVWTKELGDGMVVPTFHIAHSYFLEIEDGVAYDRTL